MCRAVFERASSRRNRKTAKIFCAATARRGFSDAFSSSGRVPGLSCEHSSFLLKRRKSACPSAGSGPSGFRFPPLCPSHPKGPALSCGAFFSPFFRANQRRDRTFSRSAYFLGIFLLFAFDFCTRFLLTCNLLLCKLQTRGRAEGSTVRGDRQKPVGPAEFSPRVPSTESRKRSGSFWTVGQRSTAGKGRSFGMAGGGGVSPPPA